MTSSPRSPCAPGRRPSVGDVVTGDRDAFQLIDPEGRIKVMATSRGITETKLYDHQAVIDRYGIAPEQIPDFYGLKGDTLGQHPGRPGDRRQDGRPTCSSASATWRGARPRGGDLRRQAQGEPDRPRRRRARLQAARDDPARHPVDVDLAAEAAREPDRSRLREVFRELRAARSAASPGGGPGRGRRGGSAPGGEDDAACGGPRGRRPATSARCRRRPLAVAVVRARDPGGRAFAREAAWRFGVAAGGPVLVGDCAGPEEVVLACGERPVVAHDAKSLGAVPPKLEHDTLLGAYLLEPAAPWLPVPRAGRGARLRARRADEAGSAAVLVRALADAQRPQIARARSGAVICARSSCRSCSAARDGGRGRQARRRAPAGHRRPRARRGRRRWSARSGSSPGPSSRSARPSSSARSCSTSSACRASAAARPASPPTHACCRRSATSTRSSRRSSAGASSTSSPRPTSTCCPSSSTHAGACTPRSCRPSPRPAGCPRPTPTCRTFRCAPQLGREIRGCFEAEEGTSCSAPTTPRSSCGCSPTSPTSPCSRRSSCAARTSTPRRRSQVFQVEADAIDPGMRSKAKMINYGIVYGLSDYGLADRLQHPA